MGLSSSNNNNSKNYMPVERILLCSIDAPFIGGAGTNSYNLIKLLRYKLKYNVVGLYFYKDESLDRDPHKIGGVHKFNPNRDKIPILKNTLIKDLGGYPDLILAKNYISVLMAKKFFPQTKLYFLPSGSSFYGHYCAKYGLTTINNLIDELETGHKGLSSIVNKTGKYPCWPESCLTGCDCELRAYIVADKIIPNSDITERLFKALYGRVKSPSGNSIIEKVNRYIETSGLYDYEFISTTTKWIKFEDREYDVIFACYSWKRNLKNIDLISQIVKDPRIRPLKVLVIGHESNKAKIPANSKAVAIGCVDNKKIIEYLSKTKTYVCPSYYDSYPNMITEADLCGCNIVTSNNVGQHHRIPKELVVNKFEDVEEWILKILRSLDHKHESLLIDQSIILQDLKNVIG